MASPCIKQHRLILVTPLTSLSKKGSRESLARLQIECLQACTVNYIGTHFLERSISNFLSNIWRMIRGEIDGVSTEQINEIIRKIKITNANLIYLDGSNLGRVAKIIKRQFPNLKIITFFHNIEARFFWGAFIHQVGFKSFGVLLANYIAERFAVIYSNRCLVLNNRDKDMLKKIYNSGEVVICPFAVPDIRNTDVACSNSIPSDQYCIFVGSAFYANVSGISWFVDNVANYININIFIIGRGFEIYKQQLELYENVTVIGEIEDLTSFYDHAAFVIAPIFDGSGMKTKVAEALMHGKYVIGSKEAFVGYEDNLVDIGVICNSAEDYIFQINNFTLTNKNKNDLIKIYESNYSVNAFRNRLDEVISNI